MTSYPSIHFHPTFYPTCLGWKVGVKMAWK